MTPDEITFQVDGRPFVDRANMPQVDEIHIAHLVRFARGRGLQVFERHVRPHECYPIQYISPSEMNRPLHGPIQALMKKPVLLAKDHAIIDGNHRWAAWIKSGHPWMPSIIFGAHIHDAMKIIWQFPFTYRYGDGKFHAHIN